MLVGEDEDNTRSLQRETSESSSFVYDFPKNIHILVVDTNLTTLLNMKEVMREQEYEVTIESDAEKAMAFLTRCKHDISLVVWDFHMPGINGIQALKDIGSKMDLPVVIMSDDSQPESVIAATINGACDYVMKPVRSEIIANIWQHTFRKRMMAEENKLMSNPDLVPPGQSDLAQSDGLDNGKAVSEIVDQEQNIERKEEIPVKGTQTTWIGESQLVQPDLVQTNNVYQHSDGSLAIYQDNGEEEKAARIPSITTWTGGIQIGQANLVHTNGSNEEDDEPIIDNRRKKKQRQQRITWDAELHNKFLAAIEQVGGITRASPKMVYECLEERMNVQGLTRASVGSHLQKHRMNLEESQIIQHTAEISGSTANRSTRRFQRSNNALLKNDLNHVQTTPASSSPSSYLMNGGAVNPIQQNHYQNGYLPMNNNQLLALPYVERLLHKNQPQKHHSPHPFGFGMGNGESEQASGTLADHLLRQYQLQQQQYQTSHQFNYVMGNQEQASGTYINPLLHQHQPQKYQSSHQFHYVMGNEEPEQASGTFLDHPLHQPQPQHPQYHQPQPQHPQYHQSSHQFNSMMGNSEPAQAPGTYADYRRLHQHQLQLQQYQSSHLFNSVIGNSEPEQAAGIYTDHLLHQQQPQPQQYQSSHQFNYMLSNPEPEQASGTSVDQCLLLQHQQQQHQFNSVIGNEEPEQASGTYIDHGLHQHQQELYPSVMSNDQSSNHAMSNYEPEQASGNGVTGLELTYPSVPFDPIQALLNGCKFGQ